MYIFYVHIHIHTFAFVHEYGDIHVSMLRACLRTCTQTHVHLRVQRCPVRQPTTVNAAKQRRSRLSGRERRSRSGRASRRTNAGNKHKRTETQRHRGKHAHMRTQGGRGSAGLHDQASCGRADARRRWSGRCVGGRVGGGGGGGVGCCETSRNSPVRRCGIDMHVCVYICTYVCVCVCVCVFVCVCVYVCTCLHLQQRRDHLF